MINLEKYGEVLPTLNPRIAIVNNKPISCNYVECKDCERFELGICHDLHLVKWLVKEYEDEPKLTEEEKTFLDSLNLLILDKKKLYIKRNENGLVLSDSFFEYFRFKSNMFKFIKENELWTIEKLLHLKVEN